MVFYFLMGGTCWLDGIIKNQQSQMHNGSYRLNLRHPEAQKIKEERKIQHSMLRKYENREKYNPQNI